MSKRVVLVGCGKIGGYHLQALSRMDEIRDIQVVENNPASVETGKLRINEVSGRGGRLGDIKWVDRIEKVKGDCDLVIVATLACGRAGILKELISMGQRRFMIEKMVCQSTSEYDEILALFAKHKIKAWVNCPRRYVDFYQKAAYILAQAEGPIVFNARGGNFGLGCNAIHFLDLFAWFCRDAADIKLDARYITPKLLPCARGDDLVEFSGTIAGQTPDKDFFSLSFLPEGDRGVSIDLLSKGCRIWVDESADKGFIAERKDGWEKKEYPFRLPYASEVTEKVVKDIFAEDRSYLPSAEDSFILHSELFRIFNHTIEGIKKERLETCPIT